MGGSYWSVADLMWWSRAAHGCRTDDSPIGSVPGGERCETPVGPPTTNPQVDHPCQGETAGRPYALYVHGNDDTTGAVRAVELIAGGIGWKRARDPLTLTGDIDQDDLEACWELGAAVAASLMV